MACSWLTTPLGRLVGGYSVEGVGLSATLSALAVAYLITTLSLLVWPVMREMNLPLASERSQQRSFAVQGRRT
jgi:hypothetical protein